AEVSLSRLAARADAGKYRAAAQSGAGHTESSFGARIFRDRDAVHDAFHARGGARLSGAQPGASRAVLRAAAIAAVVQADPDDLQLRQIFSDSALLPRRRPARRP